MISASKLSKRYGGFTALKNVSLEVSPGETLVVTGPNGSGKTTLMRLLSGLSRPTSGEVTIEGKSPRALKARIGFVGHQPYLYPYLTVFENLRFFVALYRANTDAIDDLMHKLNVTDKHDALVQTLSQGEMQRVAIARCLLHDPDFLLADEPGANVDAETDGALPNLLARPGRTLIVATHDRDFAARLDGKNLHLEGGRITQ